MRLFILILSAILLLFQYDLWFGKNGYLDYKETAEEIAMHKAENTKLSQRNQVVAAEIRDLKDGVEAIQERARLQYELVKPNETFYRIAKENKDNR
ncbi:MULTISPECIES: cell division protein FtsB [Basfia]|uniref:Cell division protein FtsB n=2 Tax=Basfia TaxID=697331 RepID=FTSB_MANSM|nr:MULTISPECIES: cell division protein FtsB [Basfia]Q65Q77.1 RecName: Full=Cell division protein FtsB [[Mannheimia] succiniciproducens MBEL55E]AAU38883.1 unknown [[Mannheimia] succiniciproducens MBEL55E]QIM69392.1 cell division protein FtsB [Basfia succiniciproducens]SCY11540.1 cell division protein FtsB [Basfia succiniciproducens]SEQ21262.1 cell division protein FtsB [Basfia succiniciproducens]